MTVGLPGAGVGGIFYLLSALLMPVHACIRQILIAADIVPDSENSAPRWGLIWRQFAMALGIIGGLWLMGWAIAALLIAHPTALGHAQTTAIGKRLPNLLRVAAIMISVGTLFGVLGLVQIARLVVVPQPRLKRALAVTAVALFFIFATSAAAQGTPVDSASVDSASVDSASVDHMAAADRAFTDEDTALARREYEAALAADPGASRALYQLGQLNRSRARIAQNYFRRYVAEEPQDAWGWIALANSYARDGRFNDALSSYDSAALIAPGERELRVGRARVLSRAARTDEAIAAYETWTATHSSDIEALRELGDQRRRAGRFREAATAYEAALAGGSNTQTRYRLGVVRGFAAPAVELQSDGTRDSDDNQTTRVRAAVDANVADRVRARLHASRRWLSGDPAFVVSSVTVDEAGVGLAARPLSTLRLDATAGVALARGLVSGDASHFVGAARGVWRQPGGRGSVDVRANRMLLDVAPLLVENGVVRTEIAARGDVPLIPRVSLRVGGRAGSYSSPLEDNTRISLLGGVAVAATEAIEVSGVFQRISFANPSAAGYFAPHTAQLAEVASYAEFESEGGTVVAIDAGAGAQRFTEFGAASGQWKPSFRLFASLTAPLRPGSEIRVELDTYDSRLGGDAAVSSNWRFASLTAALRLALR